MVYETPVMDTPTYDHLIAWAQSDHSPGGEDWDQKARRCWQYLASIDADERDEITNLGWNRVYDIARELGFSGLLRDASGIPGGS